MNYQKKQDSYSSLISGLGKVGIDKNTTIDIDGSVILDDVTLSNLYMGDGIGARIINVVADDCTRNGWTLLEDNEGLIEKELNRIKFKSALNKAIKFARLYRGAIVVMVTENGKLELPPPRNAGVITQLRVYSAARIEIQITDIITDINNPNFDDIEIFTIRKMDGTYLKVHRDRCLIIKGEMLPDYDYGNYELTNRYWGVSTLQSIWQKLQYYGTSEQGIANLMQELVIGKYTVSNLESILAMNNKDAMDRILTRLEVMSASKSIINAVLLGKDEKYERDSINFSGVNYIIDFMMMSLSAVSNIPVTRLFGRSPAGMNATGESDEIIYYDSIHSRQENRLKDEMNKVIQLVGSYISGGDKEKYGVDAFNSLWEMSDKEKAEVDKLRAETYGIYIDKGVVTAEDVFELEFKDLL